MAFLHGAVFLKTCTKYNLQSFAKCQDDLKSEPQKLYSEQLQRVDQSHETPLMKQKLKTLGVYSLMDDRKAQSDPSPVVHDEDTESVASTAESVKTRELYPWNWNIDMPRVDVSVRFPGWFIILCTLFLFHGPRQC